MPTSYTGSETGLNNRNDVVVSNPADTDALTAASNNAAIQTLANVAQRLKKYAGMLDLASTWSAIQTFSAANIFNGANVFNVGQTWNALQNFASGIQLAAATDALPRLEDTAAPGVSSRKLLFQFTSTGGVKGRLYVTPTRLLWTYNARHDSVSGNLLSDAAGDAVTLGLYGKGIDIGYATAAGVNSTLTFATLQLAGTTPASTDAIPNTLTLANTPKVGGKVQYGTGGFSVLAGYGIASVSNPATPLLRITFATPFIAVNYTAVFAYGAGLTGAVPYVYSQTTGYMDVAFELMSAPGTIAPISTGTAGGTGQLHFMVHGLQ
jgi:hypothetical protein